MDRLCEVEWTKRSLSNAIAIKNYLARQFSQKEVSIFERLLKQFELATGKHRALEGFNF